MPPDALRSMNAGHGQGPSPASGVPGREPLAEEAEWGAWWQTPRMAVDVVTEIEIRRPRDDVSAFAADPAKATAWYKNLKEVGRRERELAEQAEHAYRQLVADWQAKAAKPKPAWPPPTGRAFQGPLRGKLRGRPQSQNLRFAPGSTTP
jgi:hypothetical protein